MNTTENNKLIAEFLHGKNTVHPNQYHENWNELMQVIDGIVNASLPLTFDNKVNQKRIEIFKNIDIYSPKDKVYNACVEFIKWYNQQQLTNS